MRQNQEKIHAKMVENLAGGRARTKDIRLLPLRELTEWQKEELLKVIVSLNVATYDLKGEMFSAIVAEVNEVDVQDVVRVMDAEGIRL